MLTPITGAPAGTIGISKGPLPIGTTSLSWGIGLIPITMNKNFKNSLEKLFFGWVNKL